MVHRKQLSSKVTKTAVSTPNQITAAEEYQDHENCPFKEKKTFVDIELQLGRAKVTCVVLL